MANANEMSMFDRAMQMWREIDFPIQNTVAGELRPYLERLRKTYGNGDVVHKTFSMPEHPDLSEFALRGALHSSYFFERFWNTKSVRSALPHDLNDLNFLSPSLFQWILPVELPGSLASVLVQGGAYGQHTVPARKAMELAAVAAEFLVGGDFDEAKVFVSHAAWSKFFHDVAWDYTWVVAHPSQQRVEVVLATDTD